MNKRTVQALVALAEEYCAIEASMKKVMSVHEEGEELYAVVTETAGELERAQKEQDHLQDEVDRSCEELALAPRDFSDCWTAHETMSAKLCSAFREVNTKRATHETTCVEARKAWQRTYDLKGKASEAQENLLCHRERTRRISNDHARAEAQVNDSLRTLGKAVRAAAQATHSLTCGVPD